MQQHADESTPAPDAPSEQSPASISEHPTTRLNPENPAPDAPAEQATTTISEYPTTPLDSAPDAPIEQGPGTSISDYPTTPLDSGEGDLMSERPFDAESMPALDVETSQTGTSGADLEITQALGFGVAQWSEASRKRLEALRGRARSVVPRGWHPGELGGHGGATAPSAAHGQRWRRVVTGIVLLCLLMVASFSAVKGYLQYRQVRAEAADAMLHLRNVEALLTPYEKQPGIPDAATLRNLQAELVAAEQDFAQLRADLGSGVIGVASHIPGVAGPVGSAAALAAAADEACLAGLDLVQDGALLLPILKSGVFGGSSPSATPGTAGTPPPALDSARLNTVTVAFDDAVQHLNSAVAYARGADLSTLPASLVKPSQVAALRQVISTWPKVQTTLAEVDDWLKLAPALLGISAPTSFLVELMDRSELRSTGGFIGNYGVVSIQNGKVQPFTLTDTYLLDYPYARQHNWPKAPSAYPWWPFPGFALRDSNLSANFPTSAQMGMTLLAQEGGPHVEGVIALTAPAIASMIAVVGPIAVPEYNETVTAQNLEALIHHYQQTSAYLSGSDLPSADQISSTRKRFTALLGRDFISKLHGLPPSTLVAVGKSILASLHTKDIQIYLSNKDAEALLARHVLDGALAHGPGDGLTMVDSNVGVNKANIFTTVDYSDSVTLDAHGTATHHLTITYHFVSASAPSMRYLLFGLDYYRTYLRVYTPPHVQLAHVDGFSGGAERLTASDEPGRTMWAGYVLVHDATPYSLHFVWSVPGAATRDAAGHWHYALDVQHQAGSNQQLSVTVTAPGRKTPIIAYTGVLDTDEIYNVAY